MSSELLSELFCLPLSLTLCLPHSDLWSPLHYRQNPSAQAMPLLVLEHRFGFHSHWFMYRVLPQSRGKEPESPLGNVPSYLPGLQWTSSSQRLASVPGDMELPQTFCLSLCPIGHMELKVLPFTPFPSQQSLPFPAFSFPLSFLLPFSFLIQHLHIFLFLSKISPASEVS